MEPTPFHHLDKSLFFRRMVGPFVLALLAGFIGMGFLAKSPGVDLPPFEMARYQTFHFLRDFGNAPPFCASGAAVNSLQIEQCDEFRMTLLIRGAWTFFPIGVALIFLFLAITKVQHLYSKARRILETGRGSFTGVVTNPAEALGNFFSWFHCCRNFSVQLANKRQINVLIPEGAPIPKPGDRLAIAAVGNEFAQERFVGAIYTPHIAIISHQNRR